VQTRTLISVSLVICLCRPLSGLAACGEALLPLPPACSAVTLPPLPAAVLSRGPDAGSSASRHRTRLVMVAVKRSLMLRTAFEPSSCIAWSSMSHRQSETMGAHSALCLPGSPTAQGKRECMRRTGVTGNGSGCRRRCRHMTCKGLHTEGTPQSPAEIQWDPARRQPRTR